MMTTTDIKDTEKALKDFAKEILSDKQKQIEYLISIGVFNKKGKIKDEYQDLCIKSKVA